MSDTAEQAQVEEVSSEETGESAGRGGWEVGQSVVMEIAAALSIVVGKELPLLADEFADLVEGVLPAWKAEWAEVAGPMGGQPFVLEVVAELAGVLREADYARATLAMRDLDLDTALANLEREAAVLGLSGDPGLPPVKRLTELASRVNKESYRRVGFDLTSDDSVTRRETAVRELVLRILRGGDLHSRFWYWIDRFYFQVYAPWRAKRAELVERQEKQAITVLGAREASGRPPELSWLPAKNPLLGFPPLGAKVRTGELRVFFCADPFGLADWWGLYPGWIMVSFSEPGALYDKFMAFADDLARRAHAVADPTRLVILRMVRHFGMINTQIADYLGLARPTVSVHAKILREAGLIDSRQEGREVRHEINPEELRRFFRDLERFLDLPEE